MNCKKFDVSKIEQAIYKAFRETYGEERTEKLYSKIQEMAKSVVVYDGIGIEIQNKFNIIRNPALSLHEEMKSETKRIVKRRCL